MKGPFSFLVAFSLWLSFVSAGALDEPNVCYVLDGILFLYGIILTVLYCRIKMTPEPRGSQVTKEAGEGIYEGLTPRDQDTYETINVKKGMQ